MEPEAFRKAFATLRKRYRVENWAGGRNAFDVLVSVVVSQNSTDLVTERVMARLRARQPVTPQSVLAMRPASLVNVLKPAGLAKQKVPRIRAIAREVLRRFDGDVGRLRGMDTERAREALMSLPGVGPKTADVWLSLVADRDTMPVDTHIARLVRRWKLAPSAKYDDVRESLMRLIRPGERRLGHLVLIEFGREVCQARIPKCARCPVYDECDADDKRERHRGPGRAARDSHSP